MDHKYPIRIAKYFIQFKILVKNKNKIFKIKNNRGVNMKYSLNKMNNLWC